MLKGMAPLVGLLSLCSALAHEYEPINTEYAPPVEVFILDISSQYFRSSNGQDLYLLPKVAIEMPLTSWSQMEVSVPYVLLDAPGSATKSGFGDLKLGFRTRLPSPRRGPLLALNFEVLTPTADNRDGLGGDATALAAGLFATHNLQRAILFGNFSYEAEFPENGGRHENLLEYATAAVYHWNRFLHPAVEFFGESNLTDAETEAFLAPELIISLTERAELKWALPVGLTGSTPDWGLQFQITIFLSEHPDANLPRVKSRHR